MKIVFDNFASEAIALPEAEVSLRIIEAMVGEAHDGSMGLVGTGNEVVCKLSNEAAKELAVELALKTGWLKPEQPVTATVEEMKKMIADERIDQSRRNKG